MSQDAKFRTFHTRVLARRVQSDEYLLSEKEFRFAADCERMRVDRNGSTLSLLIITLPKTKRDPADAGLLARVLEGRLRVTDSAGLLNDHQLGILLPDTSAAGAWKVASDVSEVFPPGPERPQCDVFIYPPKRRKKDHKEHKEHHDHDGDGEHSSPKHVENVDPPSSEEFFAKKLPWWKRTFDVGGAAFGLLASAPVILTAAAAIKASSRGPVFFAQEREGLGGRRFLIWKLRTMCVGAEKQKAELLEHSEQDGPAFKMRKDPRITRVGRFLRWSSFDELPQFWNVLIGDMSLVGPRPLPTVESQSCQAWQRRRLDVTPGMTCTWQVEGRGKVKFDDWIRMDLRYAEQRTFWRDVKLMVTTLPSMIFHRGMR